MSNRACASWWGRFTESSWLSGAGLLPKWASAWRKFQLFTSNWVSLDCRGIAYIPLRLASVGELVEVVDWQITATFRWAERNSEYGYKQERSRRSHLFLGYWNYIKQRSAWRNLRIINSVWQLCCWKDQLFGWQPLFSPHLWEILLGSATPSKSYARWEIPDRSAPPK